MITRTTSFSVSNILFLTVDGGWGEYNEWSECTHSCDGGTRSRVRSCNNPTPTQGGAECQGESMDTEQCNTHGCPGITTLLGHYSISHFKAELLRSDLKNILGYFETTHQFISHYLTPV